MTTDTIQPSSDLTAGGFLVTLNGFDEIAIAARFGMKLSDLRQEGEAITLGRALIFVDLRRKGAKDAAAYESAMELSIDQVTHYFTPDPKKKKKGKKAKGSGGTSPAAGAEAPEDAEGKAP